MAREPTTIIEALACHPPAIVELRQQGWGTSFWHGACAHEDPSITGMMRWGFTGDELFVHAHLRDAFADSSDFTERSRCRACRELVANLPPDRQVRDG